MVSIINSFKYTDSIWFKINQMRMDMYNITRKNYGHLVVHNIWFNYIYYLPFFNLNIES